MSTNMVQFYQLGRTFGMIEFIRAIESERSLHILLKNNWIKLVLDSTDIHFELCSSLKVGTNQKGFPD